MSMEATMTQDWQRLWKREPSLRPQWLEQRSDPRRDYWSDRHGNALTGPVLEAACRDAATLWLASRGHSLGWHRGQWYTDVAENLPMFDTPDAALFMGCETELNLAEYGVAAR